MGNPRLVYSVEHEVAIWDLVTQSSGSLEAWVADDSGKVTQLSFENEESISTPKTTIVHVSATFQQQVLNLLSLEIRWRVSSLPQLGHFALA